MNAGIRNGAALLVVLAAASAPGCGGAGYYGEIELPDLVVTILSPRLALAPGESTTITVRVQNNGTGAATAPLIQIPGPIGFRYDSVTCLSAGAVFCPAVSVPMMAGGIIYPSIPSHTELAFTFTGVAIGDAGSRISIAATARLDGDREQGNNAALLVIPVVAAPASTAP